MAIHVAKLGLVKLDTLGNLLAAEYTIKARITANEEIRVLPDASIPNTVNTPTIEDYLAAEDAANFKFVHMDQTYLITQT